ncbi:GTPase Obg [bacterium HR17]|uniref:GTPase Obg n=1 Tax=Candidatus Fervidibacter japonicus TaxID=2035412 RepID=A0A2H5XAQ7_9BACT|nr:GTPase Obg [bacterium HR17]
MPANLTPEYLQAEEDFRKATTIEEKIEALQRMLALLPKHKGTERIQADIKRRLAKLKEMEQQQRAKRGGSADPFYIPRHGAGQVVALGFPNVGKSALLSALSGVALEVADYPYTTQRPQPVMMPYENLQIQLVDTPPVVGEIEPAFAGMVRRADAALVIVDLSTDECFEQAEVLLKGMATRRVRLVRDPVDDDPTNPIVERAAILVGNKLDAPEAEDRFVLLQGAHGSQLPVVAVSALERVGLDDLKRLIFQQLRIIRVYAKPPGKPPTLDRPFVLKRGATVLDFAEEVHRDFPDKLRYARVWGSAEFPGQPVSKDFILQDGDIVELHL